jgi:pSer/pThr/pTyr-binding forkhead associated (FHA) protein
MTEKIVGRNSDCDIVIYDPKKRVSRKHLIVKCEKGVLHIKDAGSTNGTYVNGKKINPNLFVKLKKSDQITLSTDYPITNELHELLNKSIQVENKPEVPKSEATIVYDGSKATFTNGDKKVIFDADKTSISDLSDADQTSFITIGRGKDNQIVINKEFISKYHCRIRLLMPTILEIEDLGSSNGTFADDEKLVPNQKFQFASSVRIRFGPTFNLNLQKVLPGIQIIEKKKVPVAKSGALQNKPIQPDELKAFHELEEIWNEYVERQNSASNKSFSYGLAGSALGIVASVFTGGILTPFVMGGGVMLGRYLGQQESNKVKGDLSYENAFLVSYCCPRCKESFQKKPWITINDCFRCKLKFRNHNT